MKLATFYATAAAAEAAYAAGAVPNRSPGEKNLFAVPVPPPLRAALPPGLTGAETVYVYGFDKYAGPYYLFAALGFAPYAANGRRGAPPLSPAAAAALLSEEAFAAETARRAAARAEREAAETAAAEAAAAKARLAAAAEAARKKAAAGK